MRLMWEALKAGDPTALGLPAPGAGYSTSWAGIIYTAGRYLYHLGSLPPLSGALEDLAIRCYLYERTLRTHEKLCPFHSPVLCPLLSAPPHEPVCQPHLLPQHLPRRRLLLPACREAQKPLGSIRLPCSLELHAGRALRPSELWLHDPVRALRHRFRHSSSGRLCL